MPVYNYSLNVPVDNEYSYAQGHTPGQGRLYTGQTPIPVREERGSSTRHMAHTAIAPEIFTGRQCPSNFIDVSPIDTRFYNQYDQQYFVPNHHYTNSQPQMVTRSPPRYETLSRDDQYLPSYEMSLGEDRNSYSSSSNAMIDSRFVKYGSVYTLLSSTMLNKSSSITVMKALPAHNQYLVVVVSNKVSSTPSLGQSVSTANLKTASTRIQGNDALLVERQISNDTG